MKKIVLVTVILLFTIVANFLCLTVFDAALTTFLGASESTVKHKKFATIVKSTITVTKTIFFIYKSRITS